MLVARDDDGAIVGTLTLVIYRVSSGLKARIEDVIVDSSARGQGVGDALVREGMARANAARVLTIELTSMPYRDSANRLYQRLGFVRKPDERLRLVAEIATVLKSPSRRGERPVPGTVTKPCRLSVGSGSCRSC